MTLMTSLKAEGEAEAARLAHTRRLLGGNAAASAVILPANDMWLTFARTRTTRIGLGKRVLFLFRAVCEDGCGRLLESALVPVAVDWPDDSSTRAALGDFVTRAAPAALAQARTAISIWRTHATLAARHILDARVVRERAIATLRDHVPELLQPGLFDRRVERQDLVAQRLASEHVDECGRRIAALEHACALSVPSPRLLLILAPKH